MLFGYCRVSSIEQVEGKSSLDDQKQRIKGAVMMRGGDRDICFYQDPGVSGTIPLHLRPSGARLLGECVAGDIIFAAKLDRLFRSSSDALGVVERLTQRRVGIVLCDLGCEPVTEGITSKLFFTILAGFAEFERAMIAERTKEGRDGKANRNGHIGGHAPYGYQAVGRRKDAVLVAVPAEQAIMERARTLYLLGSGPTDIAKTLAREGCFARNGKPFTAWQIERMRHDRKSPFNARGIHRADQGNLPPLRGREQPDPTTRH